MTASETYQPTEAQRQRWVQMCDTLASDISLCAKVARLRNWKPGTVHALAVEGSLGYESGKVCFLYDSGAKIRFRRNDERIIYWAFGKPWIWRGSFLSIAQRTNVWLTEGETDGISLIDAGIEKEPKTVVVSMPGASMFSPDWATGFAHKNVVLAFDADDAGQRALGRVTQLLSGVARSVKQLRWEGLEYAC